MAVGYWTKNLSSNSSNGWIIGRSGTLDSDTISVSANRGVRPVITVLKSQLN